MKFTVIAEHEGVATVAGWEKAIGQFVALNEPLLRLRKSDGTEFPIVAPVYGVLFKKAVLEAEAVEAGEPLAVLAGVTETKIHTAPEPDYVPVGSETRYTPTEREQSLAHHHAAALSLVPHQYTTISANLTETQRLQEKSGATLSAFFIAAVAAALKAHPRFNAAWLADDEIRLRENINICLPQPSGAFPVLCDADKKSILALSRELESPELLPTHGATFTLTVGEAVSQTPILHTPQAAHLYIGCTGTLTLAHDPRIADGFAATKFLREIQRNLEETRFLFV
ncbi:2-oxo acid dehydrogenase subunit E2 [Armatimonas sp.]|uniref:2-oxo acid dehydrogenase subunit E2 n=1 Tax=Armatimonas sp. TaxID=1872638 RepID=UPI00286A7E09|nr:2-oxo acid dehydrogenase subunit E2 [Armatimonas sp.]